MRTEEFLRSANERGIELVVIGTSAGGFDALKSILPSLTGDLIALVVIHLPPTDKNLIPSLLQDVCSLEVKEAEPGEPITPGTIYIAPPDYHLSIDPNKSLALSSEEAVHYSRPSIDILFDSAAYAFAKKTLGILLTGANDDGAMGLLKIKELGGLTMVQKPNDATFPTMPQSALNLFQPHLVLPLEEIKAVLKQLGGLP
jgi:two-component system chemotaxis response regulator CheB